MLEQTKFRFLLTRAILLPLVLMAFLAAILLWQVSRLVSMTRWVERTEQVIAQSQNTQKLLLDMQAGLRGYLINRSPAFLDPYEQAAPQVEPAIETLVRLVAGDALQTRRLVALKSLYLQWARYGRMSIEAKDRGESYEPYALTLRGEELMDAMRLHLNFLNITAEETLLKQSREAELVTQSTIGLVMGLAVLLGTLMALFSRRQILTVSRNYRNALLVSERQAEALRESEKIFRATFEHAGVGIGHVGLDGRWLRVNPTLCQMLGYSESDLMKLPFHEVIRANDGWSAAPTMNELLTGKVPSASTETTLLRGNGSVIWVELVLSVLSKTSGEPQYFICVIEDITERKRGELALKESEERYRRLVEYSPNAILVHQSEKWLFANAAAAQLLGADNSNQLMGVSSIKHVHSDDATLARQCLNDVVRGKPSPLTGLRLVRMDGKVIEAEITGIPFTYGGEPAGLLVIRDVTARKRLEEQFLRAQKMEAIGRLAGGIAHDFNNLLTIIIGYTGMLLENTSRDPGDRQDLEEIAKCGKRAAALTAQLLAFGRKQMMRSVALNLNEAVQDLGKMLRRLIGEDIELITLLDPEPGYVQADPSQMEQVVLNLAINARDAMPHGGKLLIEVRPVVLSGEIKDGGLSLPPGHYMLLCVTDTGCGMNSATLSHIFEPFFTTKEVGKGTGLGLSTVYGIIKQSCGDIWVYSEVGKGTTFKIYLPRILTADQNREHDAIPAQSLQGCETILLVEDESLVQSLTARVLRNHGYRVLLASNGAEALEVVRVNDQESIHLLVTDVVMPQMGGGEVSAWFKAHRPSTKTLFISGYTDVAMVHHGALAPNTAFLQKPFTPQDLAKKVRAVLDDGDSNVESRLRDSRFVRG